MKRLAANLARRREIAAQYTAAFRDLPLIAVPTVREGANPAWHLYPVRLKLEMLAAGEERFFERCAPRILV